MSTRKSTRKFPEVRVPISTKMVVEQHVLVPIPTERRERTEPTSFTMPRSLRKRLKEYAKRSHIPISKLVTFLCVKYLDAIESGSKGSQ